MKYHVIDNSLNNLGKTVLWQYDRAFRLLSILKHMQVLYHCAVEQFWDFWRTKILSIDTCNSFGCSIWGLFLDVPRPMIIDKNGNERQIVPSVYRKLMKGAFYLMKADATFYDILGYVEIIFGISGENTLSPWTEYVNEYGWTTNIDELNARTQQEGEVKTLLYKLYDPNGICRKIGGAPSNALSIQVEYTIGTTTIKAEATRRRKCGVSVIDGGDLSISFVKSPFYDEMHDDQKALFEQLKDKYCPHPLGILTNEPVPEMVVSFGLDPDLEEAGYQLFDPNKAYPANTLLYGPISPDATKEYVEHKSLSYLTTTQSIRAGQFKNMVDFESKGYYYYRDLGYWQDGNCPYMYHSGVELPKFLIFQYKDDEGSIFNYMCKETVPANQNTGFNSIKDKIVKCQNYNPAFGGIVLNDPTYVDLRKLHFLYLKLDRKLETIPLYNVTMYQIYTFLPGMRFVAILDGMEQIVCLGREDGAICIGIGEHEYSETYIEYRGRIGVAAPCVIVWVKEGDSIESIMGKVGEIAKSKGLATMSISEASVYNPNIYTTLKAGMEIVLDGEPRSLFSDWNSNRSIEELKRGSYPAWQSTLISEEKWEDLLPGGDKIPF